MPEPTKKTSPFAEQLALLLANQDTSALNSTPLTPAQLNAFKISNEIYLAYYQNALTQIYPETFQFYDDAKKAQLREQLQHTLCVLNIQLLIDKMDKRIYTKQNLNDAITLCQNYLRQLESKPPIDNEPLAQALPPIDPAASPIKYLGLTFARWLATQLNYVSDGHTVTGKGWLNYINRWRLYWVWASGFLMTVLQAITQDFFHTSRAQSNLKTSEPGLGYVSWNLYFLRFGIELFLFIKHSLPGKWSWMSEEEKQLTSWERAKAQWQQRKFALLNDAAWGTVNLLTFIWLIGSTSLVYAGNVLIVGLLVVDILLTCWRFFEKQAQVTHAEKIINVKILDIDESIEKLNYALQNIEKLIKLGRIMDADIILAKQKKKLTTQLAAAQRQRDELEQLLQKTKTDWQHKKYGIKNDLRYSCGLLIGWSLIGSVFFPPAVATLLSQTALMAMGLAGGVFCFALTVTYHAINCYLEVAKIKSAIKENTNKIIELQNEFDKIHANPLIPTYDEYELCAGPAKPATAKNNTLYLEFFAETIMYTVKDPFTNKIITGIISRQQLALPDTITLNATHINELYPHLTKILDKIPTTNQIAQQKTQNKSKSLFLEIKSLQATNRYQQRMIHHQKLKLLRATIIDALIPVVVFASLVFLPTGIGLGILAAALALAVISKLILNKFEPKPEPAPAFDEIAYERARTKQPSSIPAIAANANTLFHPVQARSKQKTNAEDQVDPYDNSNYPRRPEPDLPNV